MKATGGPAFRKILVANRGEIAVRILRAAAELGIPTVAVYSAADRRALHVRLADEAYAIGPAESRESYLNIERILDAARASAAEAIHPGYGFLAENPAFARACRDAGIVFIGPPPEAMAALGDKVRAREIAAAAGLPVVPGSPPLTPDPQETARVARGLGYPVLIKAAAGGGGKGMRVVRDEHELGSLLDQARGEAASAFGDDRVFLEKWIERPRHIEVQVLADTGGRCIHLGERECSIQRRHQKLIEECPSPIVDEATRRKIGELAVAAVRAVGYVNAGTVELLRGDDGSFYFMEVNARLQVEHPVTEMVAGVDLVQAMIEVAAGRELLWRQEEIVPRGHAIECRILAEDPARGFMPAPGTIRGERVPGGPGIRYDGGTCPGFTVPIHYDPLIGKLIAWAPTRAQAIARMARALGELRVEGLRTTVGFHRRVMEHPAFQSGRLHTGFLDEHPELLAEPENGELDEIAVVAAAVAHFRRMEPGGPARESTAGSRTSGWKGYGRARGWRP